MKYELILFILILLGCSKKNTTFKIPSALLGKWIETETQMDTLTFEPLNNLKIMNLNWGKKQGEEFCFPNLVQDLTITTF